MSFRYLLHTYRTTIVYSIVVVVLISVSAIILWPESRETGGIVDSADNTLVQAPQIDHQSLSPGIIPHDTEAPPDAPLYTNPVPEPIDTIWDKHHDAASSGDAQAAYHLASSLAKCQSVMRSLPSRNQNELKSLAESVSPPGNTVMAGELMTLFENCRTNQERLDSAADWMMLAAESGNIDAMLEYLTVARSVYEPADEETRDRYHTNAISFLDKARDRGNLQAAMQLSRFLKEEDPVAAYANSLFIITSLQTGRTNPEPHHMDGYIVSANHIMAIISQSMSESDYQRAMLLADELLVRCCQ